jgi:uncharacterized membrane protein YdjX (TVP38/TMEM64 family)
MVNDRNKMSEGAGEATTKRGPWKLLIVVAVLIAGIVAAWQLGLFELLTMENIDRLDAWLQSFGMLAPVIFILIWIVACLFFLPGLPVVIVGGLIFGAFWGTVWSTIGANLGAIAAFLVGRYAARSAVEGLVQKNKMLKKIDDGVKKQGWRMLLITRLVPIFPFNAQNYVYGLTDISLGTYILVTLPCMLPASIAFNFAAGSVRTGNFAKTFWYLGIAAVFFVLLSLIPGWIKKRYAAKDLVSEE